MVQAPAATVTGDSLPGPARLPRAVAVQAAKRIAEAELAQPGHDAELGPVPLLTALGTQAAVGVAGKGDRLTVRQFAPRCVEVAAQHARSGRRSREARADGLERSRLHPAVGGVGDMDTVHLDEAQLGCHAGSDRGLGAGHGERRVGWS